MSTHPADWAADLPADFCLSWALLERHEDEGRGDAPCIRERYRTWSYAEVADRSRRAHAVLAEAGAGVGDRVLVSLDDGVDFAAAVFATLRMGAILTMVNPRLTDDDMAHYWGYTDAAVGLVAAAGEEAFREGCDRAGSDGRVLGADAFAAAIEAADPKIDAHRGGPDLECCWLFTSGSTGQSKGARHTQGHFAFNTATYAHDVLALGPSDVTAAVSKLFFGYATGINLFFPLAVGASAALFPERSSPEAVLDAVERHGVTFLSTVPTTMAKILDLEGLGDRDLSSLRLSVSAGEALPPALASRWHETLGIEVLDGIGSAEMFHIYISQRAGEDAPGSLGRLVRGYDVRLVGPDGEDVADGESGTLWVKGGSKLLGYHDDPDKTAATCVGDWVVTGDVFRVEADGLFYYEGRGDDLLKIGGIFVSPLEVEDVMRAHGDVSDVCVSAYPDADGLDKPVAFVVMAEGAEKDAESLQAHCRERLVGYKVPRRFRFLAELPRNDRGKVQRTLLRERAAAEGGGTA